MGNRYNVRLEGTRVRHCMGKTSLKLYAKFGRILRIETTTLDVTFFRHYRELEQRDGTTAMKYAPMKKNSIYSLAPLRELLLAANRRYLEFISALDDPVDGMRQLRKLSRTVHEHARSYRGFNLFEESDEMLLEAIAPGEFNISGFQNKRLRQCLPQFNSAQISRLLKRLRTHGLIKKAGRCYKYYLTQLGRKAIALGLTVKNLILIPQLAAS